LCENAAQAKVEERMKRLVLLSVGCLIFSSAFAQAPAEKNVIYGMYSGLALLMDVHRPQKPNGIGVLFVSGSGWHASPDYGGMSLKDGQAASWQPLVQAGYTVFAINHRAAPRFPYPAAIEDVERAIRFIRFHAKDFGIDPQRIGGFGGSSGAHLVALAGMLAANGRSNDPDVVNRESAALQCLVIRATPTDLAHFEGGGLPNVVSFMRELPNENVYTDASPIAHVSSAAPPTLLIHGDADKTVSYQQSVAFKTKLEQAHVPVKLITIPGGDHGPDFGARGKPHADWPDYAGETVRWFDQHLQPRRSSQ
jgi:acetyl esterase/lipase